MVAGASHRPRALDAARSRGDGVLFFFFSILRTMVAGSGPLIP